MLFFPLLIHSSHTGFHFVSDRYALELGFTTSKIVSWVLERRDAVGDAAGRGLLLDRVTKRGTRTPESVEGERADGTDRGESGRGKPWRLSRRVRRSRGANEGARPMRQRCSGVLYPGNTGGPSWWQGGLEGRQQDPSPFLLERWRRSWGWPKARWDGGELRRARSAGCWSRLEAGWKHLTCCAV